MSRLSPLIVRRPEPFPGTGRTSLRGSAQAIALAAPAEPEASGHWLDDLRLFATGWIGGLIFFGTLIG